MHEQSPIRTIIFSRVSRVVRKSGSGVGIKRETYEYC